MAQNGTSNKTGLPHGMVPFHHLTDPQMRDTVMKLNENIAWLAKHGGGGGSSAQAARYKDSDALLSSIEANYPNAAAAASAIMQTIAAKESAESAAGAAAGSATGASQSATAADGRATDAAGSAVAAAASADRAAAYADEAGALAGFVNYCNVDLGTAARKTIYMASIVDDSTATYRVRVTFINETATTRTPTVTIGGESHSVSLGGSVGALQSYDDFTISGNGSFEVDNIATTVQVFIKAWRFATATESQEEA